jgi:diamine N-acetyltransferase
MITTRLAQPSDYQVLSDLGRKAFHEAFHQYNDPEDMQAYLDLAFHPETVAKALADQAVTYIIANWEEMPVGYAKLKRGVNPGELTGKHCIMLERIYALQAYVGKKVGKSLMEHCIRIARHENAEFLWLGVWQQNQRAIRFYENFGFKVIGTKQFVIGKEVNDDFVMALELDKPEHV